LAFGENFPQSKKDRPAHRSASRILAQYEVSGSLDLELGQSLLLESAYNGDIEVVDKLLKRKRFGATTVLTLARAGSV
jgi:hypothetical protein